MIIGIGLDVIELDRIKRSYDRFGETFCQKIMTGFELKNRPGRANFIPYLAALFAAKEAGSKALGTGFRQGVGFRTIEISHEPSGKPLISFLDAAADMAGKLGVKHSFVSMTHGRDVAAAVVVLEK